MSLPLSANQATNHDTKYHTCGRSDGRKSAIRESTVERINRIYQVAVLSFINLKYVFLSD